MEDDEHRGVILRAVCETHTRLWHHVAPIPARTQGESQMEHIFSVPKGSSPGVHGLGQVSLMKEGLQSWTQMWGELRRPLLSTRRIGGLDSDSHGRSVRLGELWGGGWHGSHQPSGKCEEQMLWLSDERLLALWKIAE